MWFSVYDYPKFIEEADALPIAIGVESSWYNTFTFMGFKTYQLNTNGGVASTRHWLDDHEYTWFVLRFS